MDVDDYIMVMNKNTMEKILLREERKSIDKAIEELSAEKRKQRQLYNDLGLPHINDYTEKGKYVPPMSVTTPSTISRADKADEKQAIFEAKVDLLIKHYLMRLGVVYVIFSIPVWLGIL
tara:strand:- start:56 stop:412 length:357 start_codon:yes stop_codon:yes gene_type:complete